MKKLHFSDTASTVLVMAFGLVACSWPLLFAIPAFASRSKSSSYLENNRCRFFNHLQHLVVLHALQSGEGANGPA